MPKCQLCDHCVTRGAILCDLLGAGGAAVVYDGTLLSELQCAWT